MVRTRINVISFASAKERRAAFVDQAADTRLAWSFVDALSVPPPPLTYDEGRAVRRFGRPLNKGEVGCFASHYSVWTSMLTSNDDQRIVLEDDVIVDWQTMERLAQVDIASHGIELIRLFSTHPFRYRLCVNRFLGPHHHLVQAYGMFLGTQGYLLTRRAAKQLVHRACSIERPVDWLMARYWDYDFPNLCLFPFPILERYVPSGIGERADWPKRSAAQRLERMCWRVSDRVKRAVADNIRYRKSTFGATPDSGLAFVDRAEPPVGDALRPK